MDNLSLILYMENKLMINQEIKSLGILKIIKKNYYIKEIFNLNWDNL
jgi:hypothetical protein